MGMAEAAACHSHSLRMRRVILLRSGRSGSHGRVPFDLVYRGAPTRLGAETPGA